MKITSKIFRVFFLIISFIMIFLSIYIGYSFNNVSFEQLLYSLNHSEGTSFSAVIEGIIFVSTMVILSLILIFVFDSFQQKLQYKCNVVIKLGKKKFIFNVFPFNNKNKNFLVGFFFFISFFFSCYYLEVFQYIDMQLDKSSIFEDYYVDGRKVNLKFPEDKYNLIYIYVESLEISGASIDNGGSVTDSYIPNLEKIALDNLNFSNGDKLGGAFTPNGTTWTVAGMVAQTAGVPLKISIDVNSYSGYGEFLPGVYSIGDILKDNGYKNYIMMGSDAIFGGRKDYFKSHGNYTIFDYNWAIKNEKIPKDYYVWWGYEDKKIYQYAKEELKAISKREEPFNFTMLTADTHFTDGYLGNDAKTPFDSHYANSFYNADIMLSEFMNWLEKQDFYDNTTVVISGDHLTMQSNFYNNDYHRVVYNSFINSDLKTQYDKNRQFTTLDMFPTTLASLGVEIEGDRLGLGTNLYSGKKTLIEEIGYDKFNDELAKKSNYYDYGLLGDSYFEMKK